MAEASQRAPEPSYHGLRTKPFRENTDPTFLWLGPPYRDALNTLRAGVLGNAGVLLLTGEVGVGKTMLARALADHLAAEGVRVAKLGHAPVHPDELRTGVARAFGMPAVPDTRDAFVSGLREFLRAAHARAETLLLVVDEAQNLDAALLDEVGELVRVGREAGGGAVNTLNVLLVGQSGLDRVLRRRKLPGGGEFVAVRAELRPLDVAQVGEYVAFRLRAAGGDRELFSMDAIAEVAATSGGVPRLINQICDRTLIVTSPWNGCMVSAGVVRGALGEMDASTVTAGRRLRARIRLRRMLYAVCIALAIGLGALVYHAGRGSSVAHPPAPPEPSTPSAAPSVAAPPAATEPAATSAEAPNAVSDTATGGATTTTEAPATSAATPGAPAPTSDAEAARAGGPRVVDPTERPALGRPTTAPSAPREVIAVKPRPRPASPAPVTALSPTPPPVTRNSPEPPPPRGAGRDSGEDPSAIIDWLLHRNPAAER